jgi:spore germination protein KB
MIIGFLIGIIFVLLMTNLSSKFPDENVLQFSQKLIGKLPTKLLGIILAAYFAVAFAVSANVINMHVKEYLLPETPFIIISAVYIILCTYGVILGIEVVSRFAIFGFIMLQGINITMILGTVKDFKLQNLLPLFDKGVLPNITNSMYVFSDIAMVILGIGMFYPLIGDKKKSISIAFWGMLVSAISVLIWPIMEIGVMGADVMKQFVVVCMQQVRSAELTIYLPRYELLMVSFFVWSVFIQSTLMFYCSVKSINHIVNIKKSWKTPVILTPFLIIITYYLGFDHNNYILFLGSYWSQISAGLSIGIPILLLLAYFIRKKLNKSV